MSRRGGLMSKKEDRIREAANLHVKIGQLQRYCELMVELGEVCCRRNFSGRDEGKKPILCAFIGHASLSPPFARKALKSPVLQFDSR